MKRSHLTLTALAVVAAMAQTQTASASGFLADTFIRPFSPQLANAADDWNHRNGRPVEAAAARVADAYVPGSGAAMMTGWEIQRRIQDAEAARARAGGYSGGNPMPPQPDYNGRPNGRYNGGRVAAMPVQYAAPGGYNNGYAAATVCRAGMYYATNRGVGSAGAPCGTIVDPMGNVWPGFYSMN
jgi:hypothetical protein